METIDWTVKWNGTRWHMNEIENLYGSLGV